MWLRELFNDRRWHYGDLERLEIVVRHRGVVGDERAFSGAAVRDIEPAGLIIEDALAPEGEADAGEDGTAFIPYHRVLRVVGDDGAVLWERTPRPATGDDE